MPAQRHAHSRFASALTGWGRNVTARPVLLAARKPHDESAAFSFFGLYVHPTVHLFNGLLGHRQSDAGSFKLSAQPLRRLAERLKERLGSLRLHSNAAVFYLQDRVFGGPVNPYLDPSFLGVLDSVGEKIL